MSRWLLDHSSSCASVAVGLFRLSSLGPLLPPVYEQLQFLFNIYFTRLLMSFYFHPTLIGGRVDIQVSYSIFPCQTTSYTVSVQAYSKNSYWGKFKVFMGQAQRFVDSHHNEYILNMRSLGKALKLAEGEEIKKINARVKMAAFRTFFPDGGPRTLEKIGESFTRAHAPPPCRYAEPIYPD